jgi:DNA topoisomerase-1
MRTLTPVQAGDAEAAARASALHYSSDTEPGIVRRRCGRGFHYVSPGGRPLRDRATLSRIRALAIPPAWTDVWISDDPEAHLQATGRDARGRKQYRYHDRWREIRDRAKYQRLAELCHALPALRETVAADLARPGLSKRKVVATVVSLMERAQLRVGNEEYSRTNHTYGATTLRDRHARIRGSTLELAYRGKSGVSRRARITDRRLAKIVRRCRDLPGHRLFQYVDGDAIRPITSTDVNAYLREATGGPFTAKDYRTWAATLGAALLLSTLDRPEQERACRRCIKQVIDAIAERLGHTPAICRASYIHPRLLDDFIAGRHAKLARAIQRRLGRQVPITADAIDIDVLRTIEPVVLRYLGT